MSLHMFECGLPQDFIEELCVYVQSTFAEHERFWDVHYCHLQASINCAEVNGFFSKERATYFREKYLFGEPDESWLPILKYQQIDQTEWL